MKLTQGVLLSDPAELRAAYILLQHGKQAMRRNGHRITTTQERVIADIGAMALAGHSDVPTTPLVRHSPVVVTDPLTTRQAARIMGVSERQARRRAPKLAETKRGGVWVWDRAKLLDALGDEHNATRRC